jgi:hypothetical protein
MKQDRLSHWSLGRMHALNRSSFQEIDLLFSNFMYDSEEVGGVIRTRRRRELYSFVSVQ